MDITKLKIKLHMLDSFLACIAYQMNIVEDTNIESANTNGFEIRMNPNWLDTLTTDEQVTVLAHECMHIALQHTARFLQLEQGDRHTFNVAGDLVINTWLSANKFKIPKEILQADTRYLNMCTEEVYKELVQKNDDPSCGSSMTNDLQEDNQSDDSNSNDNGNSNSSQDNSNNNNSNGNSCGGDKDSSNNSKKAKEAKQAQIAKLEEFTKKVLLKANSMANNTNAGNLLEYSRAFDDLIKPKLPWERILRNYVNDFFPDDYSWAKPNRRYMDIAYLPSISSGEALRSINIYLDVSGSVSDETLNKYLSEVKKIYTDFNIQYMRLNLFSVGIVKTIEIKDTWRTPDKNFDSGGTTITEVLEDINKYKATVSLILTDGYFFDSIETKVKYPTVWCIFNHPDFYTPYGKVVEIDEL